MKIADFAIDPDSCAIISEQKVTSMQATATQNKIWTPPILRKALNPEDISFKDHHLQYTKLYQVKYQPHSQEFKEYYILTSHHQQNNVEFKLFIPFSFNLSRENVKELKAQNSEGNDIFHIKVQNSSLIAPDIQDISSFLHSIYALKCIMVTAENIQKFAIKFKELSNNLNELVPTFRYRIKEIVSILVKTDRELGNEGVANFITNNERLKTVNKIRDEIQKYYPPSALHKVAYTACLMEQDINRKCFGNQEAFQNYLMEMLSYFISKMKDHPSLVSLPDVLYQVIFKSVQNSENQTIVSNHLKNRTFNFGPVGAAQPTPGHSQAIGIQNIAPFSTKIMVATNKTQSPAEYSIFCKEVIIKVTRENTGLGSEEMDKLFQWKWRKKNIK